MGRRKGGNKYSNNISTYQHPPNQPTTICPKNTRFASLLGTESRNGHMHQNLIYIAIARRLLPRDSSLS